MKKLLILLSVFPLLILGQSKNFPTKKDLTKAYTQAIADFIKEANKKNKTNFDTLYFGNRKYGDPYDDFPDIELPQTIEKTHIILISPELGAKTQNAIKTRIYINLIGWVNNKRAEFIFIVFSNGFSPQYTYNIDYKYNSKLKQFELEKIKFTPH